MGITDGNRQTTGSPSGARTWCSSAVRQALVCALLCALPGAQQAFCQAPTSSVVQLLEAAQSAKNAGESERALQLAERAVARAEQEDDRTLLGDALRKQGSVLIRLNRYEEAESALRRSLAQYEELTPTAGLGHTQHQMSRVFRHRGDFATGLAWLRKAQATFSAIDDGYGLISVFNGLGVVYGHLGELDRSLEWHSRSLTLSRSEGDQVGVADGLYAVGEVHRQLDELPQALKYFQDALAIDEATGNVENIANSHMKVGVTHGAMGNHVQAREHLSTAHDMFLRMGSPRALHGVLIDLAALDVAQGRLDDALPALKEVLAKATANDWSMVAARARLDLARVESRVQHHEHAITYAEQALAGALARDELRHALEIYQTQARIFEAAGKPTQALNAMREYIETRDMLFDRRRTSVIAAMQGEAEYERQSIMLELAEKDTQLAALALEREGTIRAIGLAAIAVVFALSFLLYGRLFARLQNRRLAREVAEQTRKVRESHDELQRAYAAVDHASLTDPLTGLANRRFLERHIKADLATAGDLARPQGQATAKDLVFFLVDLDYFKAINDREGHDAGDAVLVDISRLLRSEFKASDYVVRWGGEEFLVVVRFVDRRAAPAIAERVRAAVAARAIPIGSGRTLRCTCSIGFAAYPLVSAAPSVAGWEDVITLADMALYRVKHTRRDGWTGYFATGSEIPSRPIAQWVPAALRRGALEVLSSVEMGTAPDDEAWQTRPGSASLPALDR